MVVPSFGTRDADEPDSERLEEVATELAESDERCVLVDRTTTRSANWGKPESYVG